MTNNESTENPWKKRFLWLAVLGALVALQWPMIKGTYYKNASPSSTLASAVHWNTDFEQALSDSSETSKPILLVFTASWCPPCQVMKNEVWPKDEVGRAVNEQTIPVLIDIDLAESKPLAGRYGVSSIPTIVLIDAEGRILRRAAFMRAPEVIDFVQMEPNPNEVSG